MNRLKEHIVFKVITIVLVISVIMPSFIKLAHVFEDHKHEICITKLETHIHTLELDCEFYKFKLNNNFTFKVNYYALNSNNPPKLLNTKYHTYLKSHQRLLFYLRGPPNLM